MIKKDPKNLKESRKEGVLLEYLESKFDLVLEGYEALDKKIDGVDGKLGNKIDRLEEKMNVKFEVVNGKLDELMEFRSEANVKFDVIFEELQDINGKIDKLEHVVGVSS